MSLFDNLRGPKGSMGPMGPPAKDPAIHYVECDFCGDGATACTRFGMAHFMCEYCEEKIMERLKLILKFE